jgi:hypothetical protein
LSPLPHQRFETDSMQEEEEEDAMGLSKDLGLPFTSIAFG